MKPLITQLLLWLALSISSSLYALDSFRETPSLLARVQSGELPPVDQRLPKDALVVQLRSDQSPGEHGGQMRLLMGKQKDIRQMVIYGYARLIGYTPELELSRCTCARGTSGRMGIRLPVKISAITGKTSPIIRSSPRVDRRSC